MTIRLEAFLLISRKLLTRFGTTVSSLSWNKMEYLAAYSILHWHFQTSESKGYCYFFLRQYYRTCSPRFNFQSIVLSYLYNDLSKGLSSNVKLSADNTSLFSLIHDSNTLRIELNGDLPTIKNWDFQWEINFSKKIKNVNYSPLIFAITQTTFQKHLGIHCVKSLRIRSYSGSHFPSFGLNTGKYRPE